MTTTIYEIELLHLRQIKSHKYLKSEINCQRCIAIAIADRKPGAVLSNGNQGQESSHARWMHNVLASHTIVMQIK